jgi:hypothetical protein
VNAIASGDIAVEGSTPADEGTARAVAGVTRPADVLLAFDIPPPISLTKRLSGALYISIV